MHEFKRYDDIINAIPLMPEDKISWLIANLQLELVVRQLKQKQEDKK